MGWGRFFLLGNLGQQLDLMDQQEEIERLRTRLAADRAEPATPPASLEELQRENDELRLYVAVLLRLLQRKGIATAEEIRDLVESVDREDGGPDRGFRGAILPEA
jgi:Tfp pilus assembly protein PilO